MEIARTRRRTVSDQTVHGINERLKRYRLSEKCAEVTDEVIAFLVQVMRGDPIEVRRPNGLASQWDLPSLQDRMVAAERLLDRGFGKAPQSLTSDHSGEIVKRIEYLVHWLPKAPDDHSKIIEPEPD